MISSFRRYASKHNLLEFIQILKFMHLHKKKCTMKVLYDGLKLTIMT